MSKYILIFFLKFDIDLMFWIEGGSSFHNTMHTDRDGLSEQPGLITQTAGRFLVRISGAHALRLISWAKRVRRCPL